MIMFTRVCWRIERKIAGREKRPDPFKMQKKLPKIPKV